MIGRVVVGKMSQVTGEAAVEVAREWSLVAVLRACRVLVDDVDVGRVHAGEEMSARIAPGPHTVRVRMGRESSSPVEIHAGAGDTVRLVCAAPSTAWEALVRPEQHLRLDEVPHP
jgi:hypothetical protein